MSERKKEIQVHRLELDEKSSINDRNKNRINQKIKSIILSRASNPNISIFCKTIEGDEFYLTPGRVMNFNIPTQGISFSWDAHPFEWAEIEYSENEHLVQFIPQQATSLASNVASKIESRNYTAWITGYAEGEAEKKICDANPNRVKIEIDNQRDARLFIGDYEDIKESTGRAQRVLNCMAIMPNTKIEIHTSKELWIIHDEAYMTLASMGINPNYIKVKVTEYIK